MRSVWLPRVFSPCSGSLRLRLPFLPSPWQQQHLQRPAAVCERAQHRAAEDPVGLTAPDTRSALRIPDLNEPTAAAAHPLSDPCLDTPPPFVVPKVVKPPQA
jgi:hypothetical protein